MATDASIKENAPTYTIHHVNPESKIMELQDKVAQAKAELNGAKLKVANQRLELSRLNRTVLKRNRRIEKLIRVIQGLDLPHVEEYFDIIAEWRKFLDAARTI